MPNANENMDPVAQVDATTEPIDLAQAFKMLNQANREAAQEPVAADEPVENSGGEQLVQGEGNENTNGHAESEVQFTSTDDEGDGSYAGGSTDSIEAIDFNARKQQLLRDAQRDAINQVRREFNEQNIGYYSVAELTVRDEQTGQIRFRNPDVQDERDPNYYFKSRAELQQFCDAWNKGVDFEYRKAVNEKAAELVNKLQPTARMLDFLPKWNAMNETTKAIFDDLLSGHEIRDENGKEIGFNVDLNAVAAQAERIAQRFPEQAQQAAQGTSQAGTQGTQNQTSGPALDMPSGNGKANDEKEPTTVGEALKMFDRKNKGGK